MLDFAGRVAIVTGSGRGLGRAHARLLASRGCRVVINDIPASDGSRGAAHDVVAEILSEGGIASANETSILTGAGQIVRDAVDRYGRLDILINNAGTTENGLFEQLGQDQFRSQIELHCLAAIDLCRHAWPHLKQSGAGRIINTVSGGIYGNPGISNYAAGKAALLGFSRSLALEGLTDNIHVNCIGPNGRTRLTDGMPAQLQQFLDEHFQPERIAAFVAWLAHQDCPITQEIFEVGGGMVARVRFAHQAFVHASSDTPEAWSEKTAEVTTDGPLTPLSATIDVMDREFREIDPGFDMSKLALVDTDA
jgi:NAD(P)-dependent dehydrogenase (short-subunit alcohol dehydrogenase family)